MNRKPLVYIAGPYTNGDTDRNVLGAMACAEKVLQKGGIPYIPHLSHYWDKHFPKHVTFWYEYDKCFLRKCDYLVRMMGPSMGADKEVLLAMDLKIPVYTSSEVWHEDFVFSPKA